MARLALPMVRERGKPELPRRRAERLVNAMMRQGTLRGAAKVLAEYARRMRAESRWRHWAERLAAYLKSHLGDRPPFRVFVEGNSKLPYYSFSTLPGTTCPGAGECLNWCYSFKAWRNSGAFYRQLQNTLLLTHADWVVEREFFALPPDVVLRLYVDGDFDSFDTVHFWMDALQKRPDLRAYGYSKSWDLLHSYHEVAGVPPNYVLNLSSGGRPQLVTKEQMLALPFVRGEFVGVSVAGDFAKGFARYDDHDYHRATREAAKGVGYGKVFSCPGKCGECCNGKHACGQISLKGLVIANGIH